MSEGVCIGIDLGTTYSCVGVWEAEKKGVTIIANSFGNRTTPSWVAFTDERLVGEAAVNQAARNPTNTIYDAKRMIGKKFPDVEIQSDAKLWPFKIVPIDENQNIGIQVQFKGETIVVTPEEISAAVLKHMKQIAENYLGTTLHELLLQFLHILMMHRDKQQKMLAK